MEDDQAVRACRHEEIVERENAVLRPPNADFIGGNQLYRYRPRLIRIARDVGRGNNFAHMTETPPVEWRLTPIGQRYLILRSRGKPRHEFRHGYGPLCGDDAVRGHSEALVTELSPLWPGLLQTAFRHLPSSTEESAAGTSSSLPPRRHFQYRHPCSCIRWQPAQGRSRSAAHYLSPRPSPSGSTAVRSSFSAHRFSVSARAGHLLFSVPVKIRVINLAGRRHEAHASPGPPSNGSLRSFAPAPSASLSGSPPPPSRFSPTLPPVGAAGPWFLGRL